MCCRKRRPLFRQRRPRSHANSSFGLRSPAVGGEGMAQPRPAPQSAPTQIGRRQGGDARRKPASPCEGQYAEAAHPPDCGPVRPPTNQPTRETQTRKTKKNKARARSKKAQSCAEPPRKTPVIGWRSILQDARDKGRTIVHEADASMYCFTASTITHA